jgi:hypothetical protein
MINEQGFKEFYDENCSAPPEKKVCGYIDQAGVCQLSSCLNGKDCAGDTSTDWDAHVQAMCKKTWDAAVNFVEAPAKFVDQDKAEQLANELLGKYIAACGCQNKNQIYKASLKLLATVTQFVDYAQERPAITLVDVNGKPIG